MLKRLFLNSGSTFIRFHSVCLKKLGKNHVISIQYCIDLMAVNVYDFRVFENQVNILRKVYENSLHNCYQLTTSILYSLNQNNFKFDQMLEICG